MKTTKSTNFNFWILTLALLAYILFPKQLAFMQTPTCSVSGQEHLDKVRVDGHLSGEGHGRLGQVQNLHTGVTGSEFYWVLGY